MIEITGAAAMRAWSREQRAAGRRVGFVPTMGALHEGHLRLLDRARRSADAVVVSIFVNPTQFGPGEDFDRYPRDLPRDRALAAGRGAACVFAPSTDEVYGRDPLVRIDPGPLADGLCGPFRPGHFAGVLLVVAKLFHMVEPDLAVFGRKDAQQAMLIRRMVADLSFPVEVDVAPTVREADGMALSSRNAYLSTAERQTARTLSQALEAGHAAFAQGTRDPGVIVDAAGRVLTDAPALAVEYLELVDPDTLAAPPQAAAHHLLAVAARLGRTRLIDNVLLGPGLDGDERLPG